MRESELAGRVNPMSQLQRLVLSLCALVLGLLAIGMLGGLAVYLSKNPLFLRTYPLSVGFPTAEGVEAGAPVKMAGVSIGVVEHVALNAEQAQIQMRIQDGIRIPRGSRFTALPAVLSLPGSIQVRPPLGQANRSAEAIGPEETHLVGETGPSPVGILVKAEALLDELTRVSRKTSLLLDETTRAAHSVNAVVGNPAVQRDIRQTMANLKTATAGSAKLMPQLSGLVRQTQSGSQTLLSNLTDASAQLKSLTHSSRPEIAALLANLKQTSISASQMAAQGNVLLKKSNDLLAQGSDALQNGDLGKRLSETLRNVADTVTDLKATSEKMNSIADSTQALVGDPEVASNLKAFLSNVRALSEQMNTFATKAQPLLGDPAVASDLKETLHNIKEITVVSKALLEQLSKAAGKKP